MKVYVDTSVIGGCFDEEFIEQHPDVLKKEMETIRQKYNLKIPAPTK